jgi:thymidylate synthase (FAD)
MIEVTYVDHMGDDLSVVNAARVSFGKKSDYMPRVHNGEAKVLQHKDDRLIKYLAKHKHKSPFNHTFTTFHVKAPVFVARQLVKHEYMPWNEISRRYVDSEPEFYVPQWREAAEDKKQGSGDPMQNGAKKAVQNKYDQLTKGAARTYRRLLELGACEEQARMVLPQSMMTEWYWSGTLYAFAKMCGLRLKEDTQAETRIVAEKIEDVMAELYPVSWEALRMYEE